MTLLVVVTTKRRKAVFAGTVVVPREALITLPTTTKAGLTRVVKVVPSGDVLTTTPLAPGAAEEIAENDLNV